MKHDPLTLRFDLPEAGETGAENKHEQDSSATDQRKKRASANRCRDYRSARRCQRIRNVPPYSRLKSAASRGASSTATVNRSSAARLWWVVFDFPAKEQFTVTGTSDAQGRFALERRQPGSRRQPPRFPADMLWVFAPGKELTVVRATDGPAVDGKRKAGFTFRDFTRAGHGN